MNVDEFFGLVQILVIVFGIISLIIIFVYLAFERPTATSV
jgi:hypothetical protein